MGSGETLIYHVVGSTNVQITVIIGQLQKPPQQLDFYQTTFDVHIKAKCEIRTSNGQISDNDIEPGYERQQLTALESRYTCE